MIDSGQIVSFRLLQYSITKNIMAKDGFDLNKACPAILLNTELAIYKGFLSKTLLEFGTHWRTVRIRCGCPCNCIRVYTKHKYVRM